MTERKKVLIRDHTVWFDTKDNRWKGFAYIDTGGERISEDEVRKIHGDRIQAVLDEQKIPYTREGDERPVLTDEARSTLADWFIKHVYREGNPDPFSEADLWRRRVGLDEQHARPLAGTTRRIDLEHALKKSELDGHLGDGYVLKQVFEKIEAGEIYGTRASNGEGGSGEVTRSRHPDEPSDPGMPEFWEKPVQREDEEDEAFRRRKNRMASKRSKAKKAGHVRPDGERPKKKRKGKKS